MRRPDISIILPVYNAGPGLVASLERIDRTRTPNSEVIIVDDGSTDGTGEVIRAYGGTRPYVQVMLFESNEGVAVARNAALRRARGTFVWFVDWDDEWDEDILRVLLARALSTGADVTVCRSTWRLRSGLDLGHPETISGDIGPNSRVVAFDLILRGELKGYLWSKLLRRALLPTEMFPSMRSQSDFCGLLPVIASSRQIAFEPRVLYHHIIRDGSITNSREPDLDNLTKCRTAVQTAAKCSAVEGKRRELLLLHYDYAFWHLARVKTALRLSSEDVARRELKTVGQSMRFSEILQIAQISPSVAMQCSLIKLLGENFPVLRRRYIDIRAIFRSARGARSQAH